MAPEYTLLESVRDGSPVSRALFHDTYDEAITAALLASGFAVADIESVLAALDPALFGESESFSYDLNKGPFGDFLFGVVRRCAAVLRDDGTVSVPDQAKWDEVWKKHVILQSLLKLRREMEPDEFLAFEVYVVEGKPAREAAVLSSMSPDMVYFTKTRALKRLRVLRREFQAV